MLQNEDLKRASLKFLARKSAPGRATWDLKNNLALLRPPRKANTQSHKNNKYMFRQGLQAYRLGASQLDTTVSANQLSSASHMRNPSY